MATKAWVQLAHKAWIQIWSGKCCFFWKNGKLVKDIGGLKRDLFIHFKFGEPITIEGNGKKEHLVIIEFINRNLEKWGAQTMVTSPPEKNKPMAHHNPSAKE